MGMGVIVGGGPCGRYKVRLIREKQALVDQRAMLEDRLAGHELEYQRRMVIVGEALDELEAAIQALDDAINLTGGLNAIRAAEQRVRRARFALQAADNAAAIASANATQTRNQLRDLIIKDDPEIDVWCADWSTSLTGTVGTIEVNGEGGNQVLIRPGFHDQAQYKPGRDGMMQWREAMTPEQAYYNAAILPGWQKWKPTYRIGIVLGITAENPPRLNIDFRPIDPRSSAQDLGINQAGVVTAQVDYMSDTLASEFSAGDRVIVEFREQNWRKPVVIGFADGPKPVISTGQFWRLGQNFNPNTGAGSPIDGAQMDLWVSIFLRQLVGSTWYPAEWGSAHEVYASLAQQDGWYIGNHRFPYLIRKRSNHEQVGWGTAMQFTPATQRILPESVSVPFGPLDLYTGYFSRNGRNIIYNYIEYEGSDIKTQVSLPLSSFIITMTRRVPKLPYGSLAPDRLEDGYFLYPEYYRIHSAEVIQAPGANDEFNRSIRDVVMERVTLPDGIDNCPQFT